MSFNECLLLLLFQELCGKGGILLLVRAILNLKITPLFRESSSVVAAVSRLKSKILTIVSASDWHDWRLRLIENSSNFYYVILFWMNSIHLPTTTPISTAVASVWSRKHFLPGWDCQHPSKHEFGKICCIRGWSANPF